MFGIENNSNNRQISHLQYFIFPLTCNIYFLSDSTPSLFKTNSIDFTICYLMSFSIIRVEYEDILRIHFAIH